MNLTTSKNEKSVIDDTNIYTHECTSWMIFNDLTQNMTHLLHKNRDAKPRNQIPLMSEKDSSRKWIGLGDSIPGTSKNDLVCMGVNASGLAAVVNSGELTTEPCNPQGTMRTPMIVKTCLAECDTAVQAVEKLQEIQKSHQYSHGDRGSIFFFMDTKEGVIAEITAERCSVACYDHGYAVRANIWHNADMASVASSPINEWLDSCNREYMVIRDLNQALRASGKISIEALLATSRDTKTPEGSPVSRTLCWKTTNSASTLEINLDYPDVLSTGFFLIGPPRHTLCVPVPICIEKYLPCMTDLQWSSAAWERFDRYGYDMEISSAWKNYEEEALTHYNHTQQDAAKLLEQGKRNEAVKLMNKTAYAIWEEASKIMTIHL